MLNDKIKLPKGVTCYVGGQTYGGDKLIPTAICPKKILDIVKKAAKEKTRTETDKA